MIAPTDTNARILRAARDLFVEQGIRKTSLEEVAHLAGVSRVTVYRYHKNKKDLTRAVVMQAADVFCNLGNFVSETPPQNPFVVLDMLQQDLGRLSATSFIGKFDEFRRVYPDLFDEYTAIRKKALDAIFDHIIATLKKNGALRKNINESVLRHFFFGAIVNAAANPDLSGLNIPREEIISTIREIFLHGIIDTRPDISPHLPKNKEHNEEPHEQQP